MFTFLHNVLKQDFNWQQSIFTNVFNTFTEVFEYSLHHLSNDILTQVPELINLQSMI